MEAADWRDFFARNNCVAGVDFPFCLFYQEILAAFPKAKVVMSTRQPHTW